MGLKLCVLPFFFYIGGLRDFKELRLHGRSSLIGQIPAKRFLPQVSLRDIVAGLFSNTEYAVMIIIIQGDQGHK